MGSAISGSGSGIIVPFVGAGTGHAPGLVPDPGPTPNTVQFLRKDGGWAVPPGTGGGGAAPGGPGYFDAVRDFAAVGDGAADDWGAIQSAIDAAYAYSLAHVGAGTTVFLRSSTGNYFVGRPLFQPGGVEIKGEGTDSNIVTHSNGGGGGDYPAIIQGIGRTTAVIGTVLDASYRPDSFGILDAGAAAGTGVKHGFASKRNAFLGFQETGFDMGWMGEANARQCDRWAKTQILNLNFLLKPGSGGTALPQAGVIMGMSGMNLESPIVVSAVGDGFGNADITVSWRTSDYPDWTINNSCRMTAHVSGAFNGQVDIAPPWRFAIYIDMLNGHYGIGINGTWRTLGATNFPGNGSFFKMNYLCPFTVFGGGGDALPFTGANSYPDWEIHGLLMSRVPLYVPPVAGVALARTDTAPDSDTLRYFTSPRESTPGTFDETVIGYLPMTDVASGEAAMVSYRTVLALGRSGTAFPNQMGIFYSHTPDAGQQFPRLTSIAINKGKNPVTGYGLMIGGVLDSFISRCDIYGGGYGIGTPNFQANYTVHVEYCTIQGLDSNYYAWSQECVLRENTFCQLGNFGVKLAGCNAKIYDSFFKDSNNTAFCVFAILAGQYDSQYYIDGVFGDTESGGLLRATVWAQGAPYTGTTLDCNNFLNINQGNGPFWELQDLGFTGDVYRRSTLRARNIYYGIGTRVKLTGNGWQADLESSTGTLYPQIVHDNTWNTTSNVRLVNVGQEPRCYSPNDLPLVGPPLEGSWYQGAHVLYVANPKPGQPSGYMVTSGGVCGSATAPVFSPINPVLCPIGTLVGFADTREWMSCTLTP